MFDIAPKNWPSQKESSLATIIFQHVKLQGVRCKKLVQWVLGWMDFNMFCFDNVLEGLFWIYKACVYLYKQIYVYIYMFVVFSDEWVSQEIGTTND